MARVIIPLTVHIQRFVDVRFHGMARFVQQKLTFPLKLAGIDTYRKIHPERGYFRSFVTSQSSAGGVSLRYREKPFRVRTMTLARSEQAIGARAALPPMQRLSSLLIIPC